MRAHRQRALDLAAVLINTAKAIVEAKGPPVRGGRWRRAVRSKNRRIRRKGEKARARAQAIVDALYRSAVIARGAVRASVVLSQRPPSSGVVYTAGKAMIDMMEIGGGTVPIGQRCTVRDEPGVHPVHGAYDSVLEPDEPYFEIGKMFVGSIAPFIGPRRQPKAWGRIGSTAIGGPAFTKHTRSSYDASPPPPRRARIWATDAPIAHTRDDGNPDYLAADLGDPLRAPGEDDDVPAPWLEGLLDEATREPLPVVELPELPEGDDR